MKRFNVDGVNKATWVRVIGLFLILINQISISFFEFKLIPFADAEIYEGISVILTVAISIVAGWKNNSFTEEAQEADKIMVSRKKRKGDR